jgi:hypothetical protein
MLLTVAVENERSTHVSRNLLRLSCT